MSLTMNERHQLSRIRLARDETDSSIDWMLGAILAVVLSVPVWALVWWMLQ